MKRPLVLLADDDAGVRFTLGEVLAESAVDVLEAKDGQEALELLEKNSVDLVITDLKMPEVDGMELLRAVRAKSPEMKVVMITAHGSEAQAVQAMKLGAFDYFKKPFDVDAVAAVVKRATETVRLDHENRRLRAALALTRFMVFRSEEIARVAERVERAAPRDVTVLITGESGTGKELIADALYAASQRSKKSFVKFNCAAIPREVAESELFGHAAGAFTGAVGARRGIFREAHGGTLFLDEIGELDLVVQGKLLRVLQQGEVKPVGADRVESVDVRMIAATHRDLKQEVAAGRFREDLFYRLDVVHIHVPALRERREDIEPLIDYFLRKYAERFGVLEATIGAKTRAELASREWRGNVRELEHAVERIVALFGEDSEDQTGDLVSTVSSENKGALGLRERVDAFERALIDEELKRNGGNRSSAARSLKVSRVTLIDKIKKYAL
jgi:DNA-binding NtrC family response regulator